MMERPCGIVHNSDSPAGGWAYLPLEELRVKVLILDVSARVTMTQIYSNPSDKPTKRAKYYFPVPASAAVCAFEMRTEDGRVITGECKEKDQAREEYEQAIGEGKHAGMLEWITADIFTISVGSIPAKQTVETKLVFVLNLMNDDNADEIRFQLPVCVGERYGDPPPELATAAAPSPRTRIRITADIQTSGRIQSIISPSHGDEISEKSHPTHLGRPSRRRKTIKFRSRTFLERDFVLVVHADNLDASRCFAELGPGQGNRDPGTVAMQLTIVPKFDLPPIPAQEYLFVVDRSGSMSGQRIINAGRTLAMLLRMLPTQNSTFNIFGFGSIVDSLFPQTLVYTQDSLTRATEYAKKLEANYGGTEIRQALKRALSSRSTSKPTVVFVLTDGEVNDGEVDDMGETFHEVDDAVKAAPPNAPLRVFTLGIGSQVSSAMCEGIARAGNGVCLFAVDAESMAGKCARLLRAGRTPIVENVTIDWGVPNDHLTSDALSVNFSSPSLTLQPVRLRPPPGIQQSPPEIHDIHAGTRFNVFVIFTLKRPYVPKNITLRGQLQDGGEFFALTVPVKGVQLEGATLGVPLVHTLAASRLILDHSEKRSPLPLAIGPADESDIRKAAIVRLGVRYQLASRYTSFVAIESSEQHPRRSWNWEGFQQLLGNSGLRVEQDVNSGNGNPVPEDTSQSGWRKLLQNIFSWSPGYARKASTSDEIPGAWPESPSVSPSRPASRAQSDEADEAYESSETFSTMSSLQGSAASGWSDWSTPPPSPRPQDAEAQRSPSPELEPLSLAPEAVQNARHDAPSALKPPPAPPAVKKEVLELFGHQQFNGSFRLNDIESIVGPSPIQEAPPQVDGKVWATAVAVAFMTKHMGTQKEILDDLLAKSLEFLRSEFPDFEKLITRAKDLIPT